MDIKPLGIKKNVETDESLTIIHQNIKDLPNKINDFIGMLTLEHIIPQVMCFSEHHMTEYNLNLLDISNYTPGAGLCHQTYQKGGVCIYIRKDLCYRSTHLAGYCEEKNHELSAIQIRCKTS